MDVLSCVDYEQYVWLLVPIAIIFGIIGIFVTVRFYWSRVQNKRRRKSILLVITLIVLTYLTALATIYFAFIQNQFFNPYIENLGLQDISDSKTQKPILEQINQYHSTMLMHLRVVIAGSFGILLPVILALYNSLKREIHKWTQAKDKEIEFRKSESKDFIGLRNKDLFFYRIVFIMAIICSLGSLIGLFLLDELTTMDATITRILWLGMWKTLGYGSQLILILMLISYYVISAPIYPVIYEDK